MIQPELEGSTQGYPLVSVEVLRSILMDSQVTLTKHERMTKPCSPHRFIANCFNAGHLKMGVKAVEQHRVESKTFQAKMNKVLNENERLLEKVISKDVLNLVVNSTVNNVYEPVHELIKKMKERIKSLSGNIKEDKIKQELEEIETINIKLGHRVTKLIAENEHLKQTYNLQEKVLVITALKDNLRKLKGKVVVDEAVILHPIDPELLKIDVAPLAPKLQNNRTAHYDYLKRTQEETVILRKIVKHERLLNLLNTSLDYALNLSTSASESQPSGNTKKDKIQQTPSSSKKNKLEAHPRNVRSSLSNKNCVVKTKNTASVQNSKSNVNSNLQCVTCNGCLFSDNHDSCVLDFIYNVNARVKSKSVKKTVKRKIWKPTGKVGISHETSVACSPQQNDVVKRRNRTLIKAARTMLIYARAPLFLWAEAVATACFTQNRSIIHVHHEKTPYELLHETLPDLSYFYVFGALCYPTNDSENLRKLQLKADIGFFIGYAPIKKVF
nr:retrovirus-related Pol polyprotein from transposon TNT 1-94 [Tanacetum cinerariifolium]